VSNCRDAKQNQLQTYAPENNTVLLVIMQAY